MPEADWFKRTYPQFTDDPQAGHWIEKPTEGLEFRYYGTELDEIVAQNVDIHFECMDTGAWWMVLKTKDGKHFHVNLGVKRTKSAGELRDETWVDKHLTNWAFHEEDG